MNQQLSKAIHKCPVVKALHEVGETWELKQKKIEREQP